MDSENRREDRRAVSRRRFLREVARGAGAVGAGLYVPLILPPAPEPLSGRSRDPKRVLVLGAGLAGLAAAWELEEAGHDVTLLEARTRPGGRVHTLREPFADGLYAEAGAAAFSAAYTEAGRYIDELGLERADWAQPELRSLYHLNGRRFSVAPDAPPEWPYELHEEERGLGPMGIMQRYLFDTLPAEISEPGSWDRPPLVELDRLSLAEYMRQQGASTGAVELVADTQWFGPRLDNLSALSSAVSDMGLFYGGRPFVLAGGNDRLPAGMADRLSRRIRYGVRVTAIREMETGVEVRARRGDRPQSHRADRVICTLPATVLRQLRFEPALSDEKRSAIDGMPYLDATRTFFQVRRCFWYDEGVTGTAPTDLAIDDIGRQPYADPGGPEERAVLESFVRGPAASRLAVHSDAEIVERTLRQLQQVHPKIREFFEGGVVKAWGEDPYALGCVSWPAPGDVTRHLEPLQRPHGRVHFAGEHTTILRSTMEGALRSGIRAAREVDGAG